jgi:hypothetical protein
MKKTTSIKRKQVYYVPLEEAPYQTLQLNWDQYNFKKATKSIQFRLILQ